MTDGSFGACSYTTAQLARLRHPDGREVFPAARRWLLANQKPDGSWGGRIFFPHDRIVSTLAAMVALDEADIRDREGRCVAVLRAGEYLNRNARRWRQAMGETVAFGPLMRELIGQAQRRELPLPYREWAGLGLPTAGRRCPTPGGSGSLPPAVLRPEPEMAAPGKFTGVDGAVGRTPADTAAYWTSTADPSALRHLRGIVALRPGGGVPSAYPTEVFELAFVLDYLRRADLPSTGAGMLPGRLRGLLDNHGCAGFSRTFPDAGVMATALTVLSAAGHEIADLLPWLLAFETRSHFAGYPDERRAAVGVNARVLEAFGRHPAGYQPQIAKIARYLMDGRQDGAWWSDRGHVSPYYATAQVAFALPQALGDRLQSTRMWMIDSQRPDGSWGWFETGTAEETGFAVLALDALARRRWAVPPKVWRAAAGYLRAHLADDDPPELWVGKTLFAPAQVVGAVVLAGYTVASRWARAEPGRAGQRPLLAREKGIEQVWNAGF
ncbi:hypothetical protein [Amycolatopsis sp. H20-H5]|uniref:hypothetical protein n=1 Tax=Amycolatopsis sp. H20-H5 TaxID=3046309 RepID=UPI002DBB1684|nr:hypothetical protein [Amycolatopsis sp. H20-H5]MEC3981614.1 hypothetical protein [Amycolatopsis sp. H20-H5]